MSSCTLGTPLPPTHFIARCTNVLPTVNVAGSPSTRHSSLVRCLPRSPSCLKYAFTDASSSFATPRHAFRNNQSRLDNRFLICLTSSFALFRLEEGRISGGVSEVYIFSLLLLALGLEAWICEQLAPCSLELDPLRECRFTGEELSGRW